MWVTASEVLWGWRSLAIDRPELGIRNALTLMPSGPLDAVTLIPGLLRNDVYGSGLKALRQAIPKRWRLLPFAYDWRRAPTDIVADLEALAAQAVRDGADDVRVLAHSMGAMVTAAWLLQTKLPVRRVAFMAGAFRGTAKMFRVLQIGDPVARNWSLLSADALGSFISSYYFLPDAWPYVVDERGEPFADELCDVALWERQGWGLFRDGQAQFAVARRAFFHRHFAESRTFLRQLNAADGMLPNDLQVLNVIGSARKTLNRVVVLPDGKLILNAKQRDAVPTLKSISLAAPGDETIASHAAELPPVFAAHARASLTFPAAHMGIVQRGPALDAATAFLLA